MSIIHLTKDTFTESIKSKQIVLVDFYANWCGPCKMLGTVLEEVAGMDLSDTLICKINVDEESQLAAEFDVQTIPTILVFKNGELKIREVGYKSKEQILEMLK